MRSAGQGSGPPQALRPVQAPKAALSRVPQGWHEAFVHLSPAGLLLRRVMQGPVSFSPLPAVCDVMGTFSGPGTGLSRERLRHPALSLHAHEAARGQLPAVGWPCCPGL